MLGLPPDAPEMKDALAALGVALPREPEYPDRHQYFDYLSLEDKGIRLVFGDEAFYRANGRPFLLIPLVLTSVCFYGGDEYYHHARFTGALPHGLVWEDSRQNAWKKLGQPQWQYKQSVPPMVVDRWDFKGEDDKNYWLLVFYSENESAIRHLQLGWAPAPQPARETVGNTSKETITFAAIAPLLHKPWNTPTVRERFAAFAVEKAISECDEGCAEVDAVVHDGIELYFDPPSEKDAKDGEGNVYRFSGLRMFRFGDSGSKGYKGTLPNGLVFADKPEVVIAKVGSAPVASELDEFSGYFVWNLPDYLLHVMFSVQEQRIDRVTVIAHGYYEEDLLT